MLTYVVSSKRVVQRDIILHTDDAASSLLDFFQKVANLQTATSQSLVQRR